MHQAVFVLFIYLWGKNPTLAFWEVLRLARRRGERVQRPEERIAIVETTDWNFYRRLAYFTAMGPLWDIFRSKSDLWRLRETGLPRYTLENQPFAVRSFGRKSSGLERAIGWWLEGEVRLTNPKTTVGVVRGKKIYVFAPVILPEDFSTRDAKNRPYFHPASLNARDARALVNLSAVLPEETLLDPFCGAGGILIEAGLVGAKPVGVEIKEDVARGCRENLKAFGVNGKVIVGDATKVSLPPADAVATDLPYGRSTVITKEIRSLYLEAFENVAHSLRGKYAVFVADRDVSGLLSSAGFNVEKVINWYVHKSLTRRVHICLLQK